MRSHAKASSAGSTRHSFKGRARFIALVPVLACLLLALLVGSAAPATAATPEPPKYLGSFGPDGTEATDFESPTLVATDEETGAVYVGDSKKQTLYKFDSEGNPLNWGGSAGYISGHEITGLSLAPIFEHSQGAVDSATHVLYVMNGTSVRAFEANGEPHKFTVGPGAETSEIPTPNASGVAVDVSGRIYVSLRPESYSRIRVYSPSGALLTEFTPELTNGGAINAGHLAVDSNGALYVRESQGIYLVRSFEPSQFPVTPTTTYALNEVPLDGENIDSYSLATDPITDYVYLGQFRPGVGVPSRIRVFDENANFVGTLGSEGEEGELQGPAFGIAVNGTNERTYALDPSGGVTPHPQVRMYETFLIPPLPPTVTTTSVIELDMHTATLRAEINPNTLASTYHFEYGLDDCSTSSCTSVPLTDVAIGDDHKDVGVSQDIAGLQPGTTYHYRVVAGNSEGITKGPNRTFTTPRTGLSFGLADDRAWEMVSPPNKFGGKILQFNQGVMQAAADGNGLAYESVTSIEAHPDGNRAIDTSTVLARRGAAGWRSKDISTPHTDVGQLRFGGEYKTFSSNLERALLEQQGDTLLSPEASEETPYLRENTEPATYRPLVTSKEGFANVPPGTVFGGQSGSGRSSVAMGAANPALTHLILRSRTPLVPGAVPGSLYLWEEGQLQPVSELPASEGGAVVGGEAGSGQGSIRHAVSEDGSLVFWGSEPYANGHSNNGGLYVRDTVNQETGRLDVVQPGASGEGANNPAFRGASADGTVVFFTDAQQLTADASPPNPPQRPADLYRCEVGPVEGGLLGCASLIDVSAPIEGSGERAEVIGTVPALSEDGTRVYFVAKGVLDTAPNEAVKTAVAGEPNLYLWQEGQGTRFIATLSNRDRADWGGAKGYSEEENAGFAHKLSAAGSPSGRYFAFMSERSLTGYDNRDVKSEEPLEEVFRYDAVEDQLDCVSCNPSGASPVGQVSDPTGGDPSRADTQSNWSQRWVAAVLPAAQESEPTIGLAFYFPRIVHDNGRVFFNAIDPLVSADSNGEWDVYQWEPTGVGDCTSSSEGAAIARSAGGCVSLLSSGTAEEEATFIDASANGDDVFFLTPARLSVLDEDFEDDVYDARVDGVTATLPVINECLGEACQPAPNPPNDPTPASAAFKGAGNVASERCPASKRRVMRDGHPRCVAKKHKKKSSHKAKRAASNRRAGR